MRTVRLVQPQKIFFGQSCALQCADDLAGLGYKRIFVVTSPPVAGSVEPLAQRLSQVGVSVEIHDQIDTEPSVATVDATLSAAREAQADAVLGVGGGSAMDVAKVVAALYDGRQAVRDTFGIENLAARALFLACLPTTAGTGSEVSPNAILLDEAENLKKGIVSPHLVPDAAYVDPLLTVSMPPEVTAATGLDALIHCIEAYANRFAHPIVDLYALQGIRLINHSLVRAVQNGDDLEARTDMALASLYGGLCLAPVNTAAVHALSYPLGSEFHVAHGISNAVLLPHVFRFNMSAAPERHARIALALGSDDEGNSLDIAQRGLARIEEIFESCGVPTSLVELGVPREAIPGMAQAAMNVTRLLNNNLRELTADDAGAIYRAAYD
jgi:alcohol dehydrogenase class IV